MTVRASVRSADQTESLLNVLTRDSNATSKKNVEAHLREIKANCTKINAVILECAPENRTYLSLHDSESRLPFTLLVRKTKDGELSEVHSESPVRQLQKKRLAAKHQRHRTLV